MATAKVFQVQAKDSVVSLGPFDTINAVQDLNLEPRFNEEYYSEMGNIDFTSQSRQPETAGSFAVTSTGSLPSILARMRYDYGTQTYPFDPAHLSPLPNTFVFTEQDLEFLVFDLIDKKQPGLNFSQATLVPNAQLTGITIRVDSTGTASETFSFEAQLQEEYFAPYHDIISVPLQTVTSGTAQVPAAFSATVNSGTYNILYVFQDNTKFKGKFTNYPNPDATWTNNTTITVVSAQFFGFRTAAPFDRVVAVLQKRVPGTFPTIFYPTSARFVRGDRADVWLILSGTNFNDFNRLLRAQSVDINIPIRRVKLTEIKRNNDLTTIYYRSTDYPIQIASTLTLNETDLQQWANLQNKTLNTAATQASIDINNVMNLVDFTGLRIVVRYYLAGNDVTPLCEVRVDDCFVTAWGERQRIGTHAERTLSVTGSKLTITGNTL